MNSRLQLSGDILRQTGKRTASYLIALLALITTAVDNGYAQNKAPGGEQKQPVDKAIRIKQAKERMDKVYSRIGYHHAEQLPLNFPLPAYPNNVVRTDFLNTTTGKPAASASILTKDPPANVFNFYLDACNKANFTVKAHKPKGTNGKLGKSDRFYILNARKDRQELRIVCFENPKSPGSLVTMSWSLRKK